MPQGKAIHIAGGVGLIAEVDESRINTRFAQGWIDNITKDLKEAFDLAINAVRNKKELAIAYHGNIVDL